MRERCYFLPLNENLTLERAKELLGKDYSFIPNSLVKYNSNEDEYRHINTWNNIGETKVFQDTIRYFLAEGTMEVKSGLLVDNSGNLKEKRFRINQINVTAIFLEIEISPNTKRMCALIEGSENYIKNVKAHLFGARREVEDKTLKEEWGINKKEDAFFKFKDDFFSWVMIKNEEKENCGEMQILDINHIYDIHSEHSREHKMNGDGILNDLLSSVALILEPNFLSLGFLINDVFGEFDFILTSTGNIELKDTSYLKNIAGEIIPLDETNKIEGYVIIYGRIIPALIKLYYKDSLEYTFGNKKKEFLNKKAQEAIEGLNKLLSNNLKENQ